MSHCHSLNSYATIYRQRKIDVEAVFRHAKVLLGFTRFRLRGLPKLATEANLYFIANNMRKLARIAYLYKKIAIQNLVSNFE
ncbi:hypothetical protein HBP99_05345 [Listeria booriae]|uniref:transposase n=1 Tax=Listeria booriae TaxID=1552123 RepID=UPI001627232C|nr:hypothetical protein [Listeria booriae]